MEALVMMLLTKFAPMLWAAASPLITELVKNTAKKAISSVPRQAVPAIGTAVGAIAGAVAQAVDPSINLDFESGAVAGLAGTGLHQLLFGGQYKKVSE